MQVNPEDLKPEDVVMTDSRTGKQYQAPNAEDGGPAFGEFHQAGSASVKTGGMTLRDYFAAKAMQAVLSNEAANQRAFRIQQAEGIDPFQLAARGAYLMADAMIAERKKQKEIS